MSDRAALLAAILAFPDEDTPRLIYADWLDEHGESERAEFIRVQIELAHRKARYDAGERPGLSIVAPVGHLPSAHEPHLSFADPDKRVGDLLKRWGELWHHNWQRWGMPHPVLKPVPWRGFVDRLTCSAADWLAHADAILAEHPVRRVRLTTVPEWDAEDDPNGIPGLLAFYWPSIVFELPSDIGGEG